MIIRVLLAAIIAGMLAGAAAGAFQVWRVTPLILAAEVYENQTGSEGTQAAGTETSEVQQAEPWVPGEGLERTAYTLLTNLIMGVGFAFVLAAVVVFSGQTITAQNGVLWGLAGFIVFTLAPATGLAPELPGMPAGDLVARQTWWLGTTLATAGGIALMVLQKNIALKALGVVLLVVPNVVGAPHPPTLESAVPAILAADFAANTLAMLALYWIVLGVSMGWWLNRPGTTVEA
jgi:cobalt transporter subunit CbtA